MFRLDRKKNYLLKKLPSQEVNPNNSNIPTFLGTALFTVGYEKITNLLLIRYYALASEEKFS